MIFHSNTQPSANHCHIILVNKFHKTISPLDTEFNKKLRPIAKNHLGPAMGDSLFVANIANKKTILVRQPRTLIGIDNFYRMLKKLKQQLKASRCTYFCFNTSSLKIKELTAEEISRAICIAFGQSLYQVQNYKKHQDDKQKYELIIRGSHQDKSAIEVGVQQANCIIKGMNLTKDLGNMPPNFCTPTYLAEKAKSLAKKYSSIKTKVLGEAQMKKLNMGSLLSVGQGSQQESQLIQMHYKGKGAKGDPIVLVGKAITFDTGGISIKPSANMDEMKYDMSGGGTVFGVIKAAAELQLPIEVIGIVPSAENMPDGTAYKPGDVVTASNGMSIEVLNTDAEGRLILCDALVYAQQYNPKYVIDMATLTGACVVALGDQASALYSNSNSLAKSIVRAGEKSGEKTWRMPLWKEYGEMLKSNVADIANIGGRGAGSITAAYFLYKFIKKGTIWAHLDIAGVANTSNHPKHATANPVGAITQLLLSEKS